MSLLRALPVALCLATPATAQEAFIWVYNAHSPFSGGAPELDLVATQSFSAGQAEDAGERVPRGLIWARCIGGGQAAIRFEAFAGAAAAGDLVAFQITDDAGTVLTHSATIFDAEFDPVGGPEIIVQADGPELALMGSAPVVRYGLVGLTDFNIAFDLTGNQSYVNDFATACAGVSAVVPDTAAPETSAPELATFTPDLGPGRSGYVWSRLTEVDETDIFNTVIQAFYSVPETDDVLIYGECVIGAQSPYVAIRFAADVAGFANGDPAVLRATIPDGRSVEIEGTIVGVGAEFGVSGIELALDMSDPAWLVLAGDEVIRFQRVGADSLTISGNGPNTLGPFLADCADIDILTPESGGRPSTPIAAQPGFLACDNFGRVGSTDTGAPMVINFVNGTSGYRGLSWIDPDGNVQDIAGLQIGEAAAFNTDPGHIWMATDGPGNCLELIQPQIGSSDYQLSVEAQ